MNNFKKMKDENFFIDFKCNLVENVIKQVENQEIEYEVFMIIRVIRRKKYLMINIGRWSRSRFFSY